jgi:hypothetical protein
MYRGRLALTRGPKTKTKFNPEKIIQSGEKQKETKNRSFKQTQRLRARER